ncbi:cyclohexanecarboxylate-CoA ligase [Phreatobacter aquaticus]|uniref:3-methylmercaptopropionyl-CoA ligase n=1 Tax=Phreatobacter aquaticus TaxID=2570229 RepID=A0A4D7QGI5_9HYPH|nr:AMP-binding protein [Phreatobacter aquaticus]QCK86328.1 cyclohexanecarboxylate-CoA ligase [Phreatobacter aquaticus]
MHMDGFAARRDAMVKAGFWKNRTLLDDFDHRVKEQPGALAIVAHDVTQASQTRLTYGELDERVTRIAVNLAGLGVEVGDVVSYQLPNWWQFVALHLACLRIGAITNPIMPILRRRELEFMLNHARSKVVVTPQVFRDFDHGAMIAGMRDVLPHLAHALVIGGEGDAAFERLHDKPVDQTAATALFAARRPKPDDIIQVLYTSGTTGEPKGVMHTSNTQISNLGPYIERLHLSGQDIVFMASPLAHQTGFMYGLMMPIVLGCHVVLQDIWNRKVAADLFAAERPTFTMASTPFLADLTDEAEARPEAFRSLRVFLAAGAPIPRVLVRRATDHMGATIASGWGMTENGAVTVTKPEDPPEKAFETDGCPLPGMAVRVVDPADKPLAAGEEGRLQVKGCSNFVGYLKRPDLNAVDAEGWFDTGDLARIDAEGYVRITGRAKDIIIRGGENIPVVEIEGLVYKHPDINDVAIVAMPDDRLGERACAFVTTRPGTKVTLGDVTAFLSSQHITKNYLPERLEVLSELPRTASGKIQKFRLREMAKTMKPGE